MLAITEYLPYIVTVVRALPISRYSPLPALEIVAATGSGKTLGVPRALMDDTTLTPIFHALPTIFATRSAYTEQTRISPGRRIGYAAESQVRYNEQSRLVYCTAGHLLNKVMRLYSGGVSQEWNFCRTVVLDEVHTGTKEYRLLMRLWYHEFRQGKPVPKLLLMTATQGSIERTLLGSFLTLPVEVPRQHVVDVLYHTQNYDSPHDRKLYTDAARVALDIHRLHSVRINNGAILIFVPGAAESSEVVHALEAAQSQALESTAFHEIQVVELRSDAQQEAFDRAVTPAASGFRKIIVATNVAESSVTIPDLFAVVDTMTERRVAHSTSDGTRLVLHWISKASSQQRKGRVGRTRKGLYYHMCTSGLFEILEDNRPDELENSSMINILMSLLGAGLNPYLILIGIDLSKIERRLTLLQRLGGIGSDLLPTQLGLMAAKLSLGFRNTLVLYRWWQQGQPLFPAIVALAMLDSYGPSYFFFPRSEGNSLKMRFEERERYKAQHYDTPTFNIRGYSDLETLLKLAVALFSEVSPSGKTFNLLDFPRWRLIEFSNTHSLNHRKIREAYDAIIRVYNELNELAREPGFGTISVQLVRFDVADVVAHLLPLFREAYGDYRLRREGRRYIHEPTGNVYILDAADSVNFMIRDPPAEIIALVIHENVVGREGNTRRIVSVAVPAEAPSIVTVDTTRPVARSDEEESPFDEYLEYE